MTEQLVAVCTREQAEQLVSYDHHRVWVDGRAGIMLTYHWLPLEDAKEPLTLIIVFHQSTHQHPPAPPQIQAMIRNLKIVQAHEEQSYDGKSS